MLEAFARRDQWGVRELAVESGIPKSGLHRTLQELADEGILRVDEDSGNYAIAAGLVRLVSIIGHSIHLEGLAQPHLERARDATGETVIISVYSRHRRQFAAVAAAESTHPVRFVWQSVKEWTDVYVGAMGIAILSALPDADRAAILRTVPDPIPSPKPMGRKVLDKKLSDCRRVGWANTDSTQFDGVRDVAAPVRNSAGIVIGAVAIAWLGTRGEEARVRPFGPAALEAAEGISHELGWAPGHAREAAQFS